MQDNQTSGGTMTLPPQLPPDVPKKKSSWGGWFASPERDERNQLEKDGAQGHNIRRVAAYGALIVAIVLYAAGLFSIAMFLGLLPDLAPAATGDKWHIVVAVLAPLFTVPTVLLISALRAAASTRQEDVAPASVQEAVGGLVTKVLEKMAE